MIALELLGAILVGMTLGLLGAGGAIVTVPILVYVVGEPPKVAISESLLIVASIAAVAAFRYNRERLVDWRTAFLLAVPGMLGSFVGATVARVIPGEIQMLIFAAIAIAAAISVLRRSEPATETTSPRHPAWQPILAGIGVGALTGLVGVGGGFLLIPALVLLLGVPMRRAVATSLVVIVANSLVGFAKHASALSEQPRGMRWDVIVTFAAVGVAGTLLGTWIAPKIPARALRVAFGVILLVMAAGIIVAHFAEPAPA